MELLIGTGVFLVTLLAAYQGYRLYVITWKPEQKELLERISLYTAAGRGRQAVDILKRKTLSELPWLNRLLLKSSFVEGIERLHQQSGVPKPLGMYIMFSAALFFTLFFTAFVTMRMTMMPALLVSIPGLAAPLLFLLGKRKKRLRKFERQLPEALELIARSLKAGHAFTSGLGMAAEEFGDPVGVEFGKTVNEINFGVDPSEALMNLTRRISCPDLSFFVVAVIIQRETGGNLAEILENLARLMRERFKFQGRVRVLASEGKTSAMVLLAMPFVLVGVLSLINREYISVLFTDPLGRLLIVFGLTMMSLGALIIKRIVAIRV